MVILFIVSLMASASNLPSTVGSGSLPADLQKQYDADLKFMAEIQPAGAATPLHQKIFGDVNGAAYQEFYNSRVKKVVMGNCRSGPAIACVKRSNPSTINLTNNFVKYKHPQVARLMVIYHEARHTEVKNGSWGHKNCPVPFLDRTTGQPMKSIWSGAPLAGEPACDKTPFGSYGSSVILLKNIEKSCKNCTEKVRQDAGLYANDNFGRIVNEDARKQMIQDLYASKK
ncbi:MAG: hypothetical protein KA715_14215 [Xanthomonadaceae bacterium]|nr:hypothetical protein [Xanthomonadaceae bacterium]